MPAGRVLDWSAVLAAAAVASLYNGLVRSRQRVREGWGAIDVQLQRRASLVPNLVESVRAYADFERDTLQRVVEARGALDLDKPEGQAIVKAVYARKRRPS